MRTTAALVCLLIGALLSCGCQKSAAPPAEQPSSTPAAVSPSTESEQPAAERAYRERKKARIAEWAKRREHRHTLSDPAEAAKWMASQAEDDVKASKTRLEEARKSRDKLEIAWTQIEVFEAEAIAKALATEATAQEADEEIDAILKM